MTAVSQIASDRATNTTNTALMVSDTEIMEFYNLATSKLLTGLEVQMRKSTWILISPMQLYLSFIRKTWVKPKAETIGGF